MLLEIESHVCDPGCHSSSIITPVIEVPCIQIKAVYYSLLTEDYANLIMMCHSLGEGKISRGNFSFFVRLKIGFVGMKIELDARFQELGFMFFQITSKSSQ